MGSIVAITGMNGAGKSTALCNIASVLADKGNIVGCFSCDLTFPSLPRFFGMDIPQERALGKLFEKENPASYFVENEKGSNLFISSVAQGDNCFRYEPPDPDTIKLFLERLASVFDYVLIEAGDAIKNSFSARTIFQADEIINIAPCTIQGLQYESSYNGMLRSFNPNSNPKYVLNFVDGVMSAKDFKIEEQELFVQLPMHRIIRDSESLGLPIIRAKEKNRAARAYCQGIQTIAKMLMEGGADA